MCNGDDLDSLAADTKHDEEREAAEENAPGVCKKWRPGFGPLGNQVDRMIELAPEARGRGLVSFAVPPFGGLSFVGGERVDFHRKLGHQRAASRRRTSAQ